MPVWAGQKELQYAFERWSKVKYSFQQLALVLAIQVLTHVANTGLEYMDE